MPESNCPNCTHIMVNGRTTVAKECQICREDRTKIANALRFQLKLASSIKKAKSLRDLRLSTRPLKNYHTR